MRRTVTTKKAVKIFLVVTIYFFVLLFTIFPFLKTNMTVQMSWFVTNMFLFLPLFTYAVESARNEGNSSMKEIFTALEFKQLTKKDATYVVGGIFVVFIWTGAFYYLSLCLHKTAGMPVLIPVPWFLNLRAFVVDGSYTFLAWLPMFFYNILGEELLWRGYVQARLKVENSWLFCAFFWVLFHFPFGADAVIVTLPMCFVIPFVFSKTNNTTVGTIIHAVFNGSLFFLATAGFLQ